MEEEKGAAAARAPYLPEGAYGLAVVDDSWSALSVPLDWAPLVVEALSEACGPAYGDPGLNRAVWFLPPGSTDGWPDATGAGITYYRRGAEILVPHPDLFGPMGWLVFPRDDGPSFTDPAVLRQAVEGIAGPLERAGAQGPLAVCACCGCASRDMELLAWGEQMSGPGWSLYRCMPCRDRGARPQVSGDSRA